MHRDCLKENFIVFLYLHCKMTKVNHYKCKVIHSSNSSASSHKLRIVHRLSLHCTSLCDVADRFIDENESNIDFTNYTQLIYPLGLLTPQTVASIDVDSSLHFCVLLTNSEFLIKIVTLLVW